MTTNEKQAALNQAQMARLYLAAHSLDTIFTRSQWYRWNGNVWNSIHEMVIGRELKKYMRKGYTANMLKQVRDLVRMDIFAGDNVMDNNPNMINLANGTYHLTMNKLLAHSPDHHLTTILPFVYNPDAKCPFWERYLQSSFVNEDGVTHDPEMVQMIQEAIGYSLTISTEHQIMFWCHGEGSNGKGTLFYVLSSLLGSGGMELDVDGLSHDQYQLAKLAGKRIATSAEVNHPNKMAENSKVKALVGGDTLQVRMIREAPFDMQSTVKLWWSMNRLPPIEETSNGVWRRIRVIPFYRQFSEQDKIKNLKTILDTELSGIFNWALVGLRRARKNGAIINPKNSAIVKDEYQRESNVVQVFKEDLCKVGAQYEIANVTLYAAFKVWCVENGHKVRSSTEFKHELKRLGIHDHKKHGNWVYDGLTIAESLPEQDSLLDALE